jgi:hypothetical protein
MRIFRMLGWLAVGALGACSNGDPALKVKQFHLRDISPDRDQDPFVRGEQQRRLFGAVTIEDRKLRLGEYYTAFWRNPAKGEPVRVVFEFRQAATGPEVMTQVRTFPGEATSGRGEFAVIGEDYAVRGRVLAWQVSVFRGGELVGQRRSFMWQ